MISLKLGIWNLIGMQIDPQKIIITHMICDVCGEDLGRPKIYFADEHLKSYPTHLSYTETKV